MADEIQASSDLPLEEQSLATPVWTQKRLVDFNGVCPSASYSLPFFLHDDHGVPAFLDERGNCIPFCIDSEYEAMDHCLVWLKYQGQGVGEEGSWRVSIYVLLGGGKFCARDVWRACKTWGSSPIMPKSPEAVFLLADYFEKGLTDGLPSGWILHTGRTTAVRLIPADTSALSKPDSMCAHANVAAQLNASLAGPGGVIIQRLLPSTFSRPCGRIHLRVRFQDVTGKGGGQSHWVGLQTWLGIGAVGLSHHFPFHYAFIHGDWRDEEFALDDKAKLVQHRGPHRKNNTMWQQSSVKRSSGWHLFELIFEDCPSGWHSVPDHTLNIMIDGEPLSVAPATGYADAESAWLASERGACGNWNSVEVMHTPMGRGTWDTGVQSVTPSSIWPWEIRAEEKGCWQFNLDGSLHEIPVTNLEAVEAVEEMPVTERAAGEAEAVQVEDVATVEEVLEVDDPADPVQLEPEIFKEIEKVAEQSMLEGFTEVLAPPRITSSRRRTRPKRTSTGNSTKSGLSVECWALPDETELARLDRVVSILLAKLDEAGMVVPSNFRRLEKCSEPQHESCVTFNFGSRRLHISTREGAGGRLTLVVRCGGGFLDFVEFVRRNGALEQLKLDRLQNTEGEGQQLSLTSVLVQGKRQVMHNQSQV